MFYFLPKFYMSGVSLGSTALTAATSGAQDVVDAMAETVANNMAFFLVIAGVGATLAIVRYLFKRFARVHRG